MNARVAELVDATDSKSVFFGSGGSIPPPGTIKKKNDLEITLQAVLFLAYSQMGAPTSPVN